MNAHTFRFLLLFFTMAVSTSCTKSSLVDRIGVCSQPDKWELLKENGYAFAEAELRSFLMPQNEEEDFAPNLETAQNAGIPIYSCNLFFPGDMRLTGEEVDMAAITRYTEVAMRRAKQIGIKIIVLGSGGARHIPEGFSHETARGRFIEICRKIGAIAQKNDVTIVIEPLNAAETNFITTVAEGLELVKEVDHPNIQLLADLFHMTRAGESPESIVKAGKYLRHCHIAENEQRTAPGIAGDDFTPYLEALKKISYKGNIALECRWDDMESQLPIAIAELKRQIEKVGL